MNPPSKKYYDQYISSLQNSLSELIITNQKGDVLPNDQGFDELCELSSLVAQQNRMQFMFGNGASASFSNHMALDWTKNGKVRTMSLTSSPIITAVGNDLGFDESFAAPLKWYAQSGDLLIAISSSGNSQNILNVIAQAREMGLKVVTLSGLMSDNPSRQLGDLNVYIPAKTYGIVECAHQVILHVWLDKFMGIEEWSRDTTQNMNINSFQL